MKDNIDRGQGRLVNVHFSQDFKKKKKKSRQTMATRGKRRQLTTTDDNSLAKLLLWSYLFSPHPRFPILSSMVLK